MRRNLFFPHFERHKRLLGNICRSKGETKRAINHFEAALKIASPFNWHDQLFLTHYSLAEAFFDKNEFDEAHVHVGVAKRYANSLNTFDLGRAMQLQARFWYRQRRLEKARSDALRAADIYEGTGATTDLESCRNLLRDIEGEMENPVASGKPYSDGELLETVTPLTLVNSSLSAQDT